MNLGQQLYPILSPLVGGRVFPMQRWEGADSANPYIIYSKVSSIPDNTMDGFSGHEYVRVQIDIYHEDYDELDALAIQVIDAISTGIPLSEFLNRQELPDDDTGLYRQSMDWQLWTST
ncbi:DUF3168 domain-containing protein [Moraxella osloensis]|uniref:DUF3168 domain-containing protein n=1 Tax=Faucicola osloensis TaxID=34062 RepID=UPI00200445D3|nr:DUF3168 domain-containing protein [Moraxella osloensis]